MRNKLLVLALMFAIVLPVMASAADTDAAPVVIKNTPYEYFLHAVKDDSGCTINADTSYNIPTNPWGGNQPNPDDIGIIGLFTEIGLNAATGGDSIIINIDVNGALDNTGLAKASAFWQTVNFAGTADATTNTGQSDTLIRGMTGGGNGCVVYNLSSASLTNLLAAPYFRIRWGYGAAEHATDDSMDVDWYVRYMYTGWKDN